MAVTKILVVDDSQTSLMTGRLLLSREGYEVITARTAEEGLQKALHERPDLCLMDSDMPQVSGVEACGRLADDPLTAMIPVVLMVSPLFTPPPVPGRGFHAVVGKPLSAPDVLRQVRRLAGGPQLGPLSGPLVEA